MVGRSSSAAAGITVIELTAITLARSKAILFFMFLILPLFLCNMFNVSFDILYFIVIFSSLPYFFFPIYTLNAQKNSIL